MKWVEIAEALFYMLMGTILTIFIISAFGCVSHVEPEIKPIKYYYEPNSQTLIAEK
jgi:hypothetical protein